MHRMLPLATIALLSLMVEVGCKSTDSATRALEELRTDLVASRTSPRGTYNYAGRPALSDLRGASKDVVRRYLGPPDDCGESEVVGCDADVEWTYIFGPPGVTDNGDDTLTVETGGVDVLIITFNLDELLERAVMRPTR